MAQKEEFIIRLNDKFSSQLKKGEQSLESSREKVDELNDGFDSLKNIVGGIGAAFAFDAIVDATKQFSKLQNAVMAYTGAGTDAAAGMVSEASAIADTYDVETSRVLEAANTMTKQMGGTLDDNLNLILQGFRKGANVNGEFLDNLREYPAQFRAAGLSASESIALITKGAKSGVYSDKAADTIKEMTLSLREMTKIQRDALTDIGLDADKLMNEMSTGAITPFKAMQKIVGAMEEFDMAAQQTVIADVFKGAGEDAGVQFIKSLKDINLELDNVETQSNGFNDSMLELNRIVNDLKTAFLNEMVPALAGFATWMTNNIPLLKGIGAGITVIAARLALMNVAAIAATASTWSLSAAFAANPIGLITAGIAALVAGLVYAYNEFETFRKIVNAVWSGIKMLGSAIWESLIFQFELLKKAVSNVGEWLWKNNPIAVMIRAIKTMFPEFFNSLKSKFSKAFGFIGRMIDKIKKFFGFGDGVSLEVNEPEQQKETTTPTGSLTGGSLAGETTTPTGSLTGGSLAGVTRQSASNLKSGTGMKTMSGNAPKTFNINIAKLIENFSVETTNIDQSRESIKNIIVETLLSGVNDIQTAIE